MAPKKTSEDESAASPRRVSYQSVKFGRDGASFTYYFASIPIDDLYGCCFVLGRESYPKDGYQRGADEKRAQEIADYLDEGGFIPGNVVLAAQPTSELSYSRNNKTIQFTRAHNAFAVIDGQHRLWGYDKAKTRLRVPVAIVQGLTRPQEAQLFMDVNSKQKGVAPSLLLDIKELASRETDREAELRTLYDRLSGDPESPLCGRTSPTGSDPKKLSRVSFNRAFGPLWSSGVLASTPPENRFRAIKNYLAAFAAEVGPETLLKSGPLAAAVDVMFEVLRDTAKIHRNWNVSTLQEALRPVAGLWANPMALRGGRGAMAAAIRAVLAGDGGLDINPEDD